MASRLNAVTWSRVAGEIVMLVSLLGSIAAIPTCGADFVRREVGRVEGQLDDVGERLHAIESGLAGIHASVAVVTTRLDDHIAGRHDVRTRQPAEDGAAPVAR